MSLQITSDNIEITPSMTELAKKKAARLLAKLKDVPDELKNIRLVLNKAPNDFFDVKADFADRVGCCRRKTLGNIFSA